MRTCGWFASVFECDREHVCHIDSFYFLGQCEYCLDCFMVSMFFSQLSEVLCGIRWMVARQSAAVRILWPV